VSSLIDASESLGHETLNGDADSRIIHFDATQRRKEKMRRKSHDAPQNAEPIPEKPANSEPEPVEATPQAVKDSAPEAKAEAPEKPETPESTPSSAAEKSANLDAFSSNSPAPATPTSATALSQLSGPELEKFLIDFVVEQTGYPPEMVELDADLEADLGIDSIKKAQLFGELAERFEITIDVTDESLSLDDFPTLGHVMEFLKSRSGDASPAEASTAAPSTEIAAAENADAESPAATETARQTPAAPSFNGAANGQTGQSSTPAAAASEALAGVDLETFLVDFVVEQTGYPSEMVELDADLEADLGIDSIKKAQLFGELAEQFEITVDVTDESLSLDDFPTLRHVMEFLQSAGSDVGSSDVESSANAPAPSVEVPPAAEHASSNGTSANEASSSSPPVGGPKAENPPAEPAPSETSSALNLGQEELETFLVNFVVEQTGYPPEMVELDADLEADLGIDSIKKAQMMGELAEQFEITVDVTDENLSLDDFPTLRHVCEFLAAPGKVSA